MIIQMEVCASRSNDSADGKDGKSSLLGNGGQNDLGSEWVLTLPFFSSISEGILRVGCLSEGSSSQVKARLVESVFFSFFMLCVIVSAAAPHIRG